MVASTSATDASKAGIETTSSGDRHIPSSVRPDGSVRKEIRVRPGYRPPEDVEVYKNRAAEAFKTRGKGGVPGATFVNDDTPRPKANKPSKKTDSRTTQGIAQAAAKAKAIQEESSRAAAVEQVKEEPLDPEAEKEKEAKKLAKKLRQAGDLQQKKEKGDALLPEQFEKVIRMNELIRQLDKLGFDTEGQKKP